MPPPLLEMRHISKNFSGVRALIDAQLTVDRRRGPCGDGRERRRQIDADQGSRGRLCRRSTARSGSRSGSGRIGTPAAAIGHGHRRHLPGAEPEPESDRGREHLSRPRDPQGHFRRSQGDAAAMPRHPEEPRRDVFTNRPGLEPVSCRTPAGGDCPGHPRQCPHPRHGRADGGALGA